LKALKFEEMRDDLRVAAELPPGFVLTNGNLVLGITSPWNASQAVPNDHFSPNRVGLDHLSFGVADRAELYRAAALIDLLKRLLDHACSTHCGTSKDGH
jgi:hypothetical protein